MATWCLWWAQGRRWRVMATEGASARAGGEGPSHTSRMQAIMQAILQVILPHGRSASPPRARCRYFSLSVATIMAVTLAAMVPTLSCRRPQRSHNRRVRVPLTLPVAAGINRSPLLIRRSRHFSPSLRSCVQEATRCPNR